MIGAGAVVQTIHLPTLARLSEEFTIRTVMDTDPATAQAVAARVGAQASTDLEDVLNDESIEVVAICSPPEFHAEQTVAALRAGKRAVLCEKPLATSHDELRDIAEALAETGGLLVVGAMHVFDPAWTEIRPRLGELVRSARTVRSSIVLPFNDRYESRASHLLPRQPMSMPDASDPAVRQAFLNAAVLGLAVHDLPLVHELIGRPGTDAEIVSAEFLEPFGYVIGIRAGQTLVEVSGLMQPHWKPLWELEAVSAEEVLHVEFTPSFVPAGSATATITGAQGAFSVGNRPTNGYEAEWRRLAQALQGQTDAVPSSADVLADAEFVVHVADRATALLGEQVPA
nr:Gfo/Idh/MocA family oxidoreductase [Kineosporia babensis]